ncbi:MAG TPA: serine hydrolase domain-containing protein [Longimicrobiales bacterium]|nr:serine hydrolase domain-containing protein [Longimicrobiales bacterium]
MRTARRWKVGSRLREQKFLPAAGIRRLVIACMLLLSAAVPAGAQTTALLPSEAGMSGAVLDRLTRTLGREVSAGRLPGGVLMVLRDGDTVLEHAFGWRDLEADELMRPDAIFRIASMTKLVTTVGVLMLQEEGELLLSDPVAKYIPEFDSTTVAVAREDGGYDVVPAMRPITLRDLLTHTSGIGYGYGLARDRWEAAGISGWYFAGRDEPIAETVARMAALPFDAQPGEEFVYGYSTDILGVVIERASGQPLDAFLRERIFLPLRMPDTSFFLPAAKRDRLATVYGINESDRLVRAPDASTTVGQGEYVDGPRKSFSGGAGLLSTAGDYARFLQMLLQGGTLDGVRILSPKSVQLMTVNHTGDLYPWEEGVGFGLGVFVVMDLGERGTLGSVGEFGWNGAYHTAAWVDPQERLVVVYLTQVIPATGLTDFGLVRAGVYGAITDAYGPTPRP